MNHFGVLLALLTLQTDLLADLLKECRAHAHGKACGDRFHKETHSSSITRSCGPRSDYSSLEIQWLSSGSDLVLSGGMGIGSLSKYRRSFMIAGFVIFAGGAVMRWHHKRQVEARQGEGTQTGSRSPMSWHNDCVSYACRVVGVRGGECMDVCDAAVSSGSPKTRAERMARACKKQCVADETATAECRSSCFVREARKSGSGV